MVDPEGIEPPPRPSEGRALSNCAMGPKINTQMEQFDREKFRTTYLGYHTIHGIGWQADRIVIYYQKSIPDDIRWQIAQDALPYDVVFEISEPAYFA